MPGDPIAFEEINDYLGGFPQAPVKIQKWVNKIQPIVQEILGISHCYFAFDKSTRTFFEDNLSLSVKAAKKALDMANIKAADIDLIIYGGAHSEQMPPLSTRIQEALGIERCAEFQIHANCTSAYKAVKLADTMLRSAEYQNALVISSSIASACFIPEFYNQEVIAKEDIFLRWYLCDGAGAMVFTAQDTMDTGFFLEDAYIESAGGKKRSAMYNELPNHVNSPLENYKTGAHHISQIYLSDMREHVLDENGKTVFYNALDRMLTAKNIDLSHLKYFVVNMPSRFVRSHIIEECLDFGIEKEKFYSTIEKIGYTGPPAAIISIDKLLARQSFENEDLILSFVMEISKFMQAGFTLRYYQ